VLEEFPPYCLNESQMEQLIPIEDVNNNYSCHGGHLPAGNIQTSPDDAAVQVLMRRGTYRGQHLLNQQSIPLYITINNELSTYGISL